MGNINEKMCEACDNGNWGMFQLLVKKGANINFKNRLGKGLLHYASRGGNMNIIKYLISNGVDVNMKSNRDGTPLQIASKYRHINVVKYLLENGAQVDAFDITYRTALFHCNYYGDSSEKSQKIQIEMMKVLVSKGAKLDFFDFFDDDWPIWRVVCALEDVFETRSRLQRKHSNQVSDNKDSMTQYILSILDTTAMIDDHHAVNGLTW